MGSMIWHVVCVHPGLIEPADDVARSLNGFLGAELQRRLRPHLQAAGYAFGEAWPEDHGWDSDPLVPDAPKRTSAQLVTCGTRDEAAGDGRATDNSWQVAIGITTGWFGWQASRNRPHLKRLAGAVQAALVAIGAENIAWEEGGP